MAASKKGVSAHQLHRMLGVTYKTAWFMEHRIREAMRDVSGDKLGGAGKIVEADETYVGGKPRRGTDGKATQKDRKTPVAVLVERGRSVAPRGSRFEHPLNNVLKVNIIGERRARHRNSFRPAQGVSRDWRIDRGRTTSTSITRSMNLPAMASIPTPLKAGTRC